MIHYALRCAAGHGFDGWFPGSAAFDRQASAGLLCCPVCASAEVSRAIMSPSLGRGAPAPAAADPAPAPRPDAPAKAATEAPSPLPDQVRAALQRLRADVEQRCDYVGPHFAEAARSMHAGHTPPRPIYGEATPEQAEELAEDGIAVAQIPWVPRADG